MGWRGGGAVQHLTLGAVGASVCVYVYVCARARQMSGLEGRRRLGRVWLACARRAGGKGRTDYDWLHCFLGTSLFAPFCGLLPAGRVPSRCFCTCWVEVGCSFQCKAPSFSAILSL